jgi:hypothetical protein
VRYRALLLVGFAGAFRCSELVALDRSDVSFDPDGLRLLIRASKTDQEQAGAVIDVPFGEQPYSCAVRSARLARHLNDDRSAILPAHEPLGLGLGRLWTQTHLAMRGRIP